MRTRFALSALLVLSKCTCPDRTMQVTSQVQVSPVGLDFGAQFVGTQATRTLTLTNTGRAAAAVTTATEAPFAVASAQLSVPAGESVELTITFSPTEVGLAAGRVTFTGTVQAVSSLTGEGKAIPPCPPAPTCSSARFDVALERCVVEVRPDGTSCSNTCLVDARCVNGECRGTVAPTCDDGNACTIDACSGAGECVHTPRDCAVTEACTAAYCDPQSGCGSTPLQDGTSCGEPTCRQSPICLNGACVLRDNPGAADVCTAVDIAATSASTCVLTKAKTVRCWGFGYSTLWSPLGHRFFTRAATIPRAGTPTSLSMDRRSIGVTCTALAGGGFEGARVVDAGSSPVTEVYENDQARCWLNAAGEVGCLPPLCRSLDGGLGVCLASMPLAVTSMPNVRALSAGDSYFAAVRPDGGVSMWGRLWPRFAGDAGASGVVELSFNRPVRAYRVGGGAVDCAQFEDDRVECQGRYPDDPLLTLPGPVAHVVAAYVGEADVITVLFDGGLEACVVDGGAIACAPPFATSVPPIAKVAAVVGHACFLTRSGDVGCYGMNHLGQLADLSGAPPTIKPIPGVTGRLLATSLRDDVPGVGVVSRDGGLLLWRGLAPFGPPAVPFPAAEAIDLVTHPMGVCTIERDGGGVCLVNGARATVPVRFPVPMQHFSPCPPMLAIDSPISALGRDTRCAFTMTVDGGTVSEPFCVSTDAVAEVCRSTPAATSCTLGTDAGVRCRGSNRYGQLGPAGGAFPQLGPVSKLAMSLTEVCALERSGRVQCWGTHAVSGTISPPTPLPILPFARDLTCGDTHCCVLVGENGVSCWGLNTFNQLGRDVPASDALLAVPLPKRVEQLMAYGSTTCARLIDDEIWCWGDNRAGERGLPILERSAEPVWVTQ